MNNIEPQGTLVSTYYAENNGGRAEVYAGTPNQIIFYDSNGNQFHGEVVDGALHVAEQRADDWAMGYEVLYG